MITKELPTITFLHQSMTKLGRDIKISITNGNSINFAFPSTHRTINIFPSEIIQKVFTQLIIRANKFFVDEMSLTLESDENPQIIKEKSFETRLISSWLIISGAFKGLFIFSYEKKLTEYILSKFLNEPIKENEYNDLFRDMVSEITNIISGGASDSIHDSMGNSILEVPVTIIDKKLKCRCDSAEFLTYHGLTNKGYFEITTMISKF